MINKEQVHQMTRTPGFVAALDQSGGSTPKALELYGINSSKYSNDHEMFDLIHQMRCRIMRSPKFNGKRIIGAILFKKTLEREVAGIATPDYLWKQRQIVPFLKVDNGLADEKNHSQILKPIPELDLLLKSAKKANIFGTKMRSVIHRANETGVDEVVKQQFDIGHKILSHNLVPIIEPEININCSEKAAAEEMLLRSLKKHLNELAEDKQVILKLTLPEAANHYFSLTEHPRVMRVVALSGGYSRELANEKLSYNANMIASFSRALTEGLSVMQTDSQFNAVLGKTITEISTASAAGAALNL